MSFPRGIKNSEVLHRSFFRLVFLQIQSPGLKKTTDSSGGETPGATSLPGSLTVEAALVLTLVIFGWTALITLFSAMQIHMKLRYAMEQTAEEFAMLAYLTQDDGVTTLALYSRILTLVGQDVLEESCIRGGSQGIILLGSSGLTEEGDFDICLT